MSMRTGGMPTPTPTPTPPPRPQSYRLLSLSVLLWTTQAGCDGAGQWPPEDGISSGPVIAVATADDGCRALATGDVLQVGAVDLAPANAVWTRGGDDAPINLVSDAAFLPGGDVAVLSEFGRELWVYGGVDGATLRQLGRSGDGPGEFRQVRGFNVYGDGRIVVYDRRNARSVIFEADGTEAGVQGWPQLDGLTVDGVLGDGRFLMSTSALIAIPSQGPPGRVELDETAYALLAVDHDADAGTASDSGAASPPRDTVRAWTTRTVRHAGQRLAVPFGPLRVHELKGRRLAWVEGSGVVAHAVDFATGARSCWRWSGSRRQVGGTLVDSLAGAMAAQTANRPDVTTARLAMFEWMVDEGVLPSHLPAFVAAEPGPDGTVWLTLGVALDDTDGARATAVQVTADGAIARRATLPPGASVWTAGADRLLLGWYDAMMREWIGVFVLPPAS